MNIRDPGGKPIQSILSQFTSLLALLILFSCMSQTIHSSVEAKDANTDDSSDHLKNAVRCLSYLNASKDSVGFVSQVVDMGFNLALVMLGNAPLDGIVPVIEEADRRNLPLLVVDYIDNNRYFSRLENGEASHYVAADGRSAPHLPCPCDAGYWQAVIGRRAAELARLRKMGHGSVAGFLFDVEDYAGTGDLPCGGSYYCYCDRCFSSFLESEGEARSEVSPGERKGWLTGQNLIDGYYRYQDAAVVDVLQGIRKQIDGMDPDFIFATYPWPTIDRKVHPTRVPWDVRFVEGLGTDRAPFMLFAESTYIWGYDPSIERQEEELKASSLPYVAVTGFNMIPAERIWWPEEMVASSYWASLRSGGYWIYVGDWPLLYGPMGKGVSGLFGEKPETWVRQFSDLNRKLASGEKAAMPLLPLPPLKDCLELTGLYDPKHAPETECYVRPWSAIGLPWEGGEWVMLGRKAGDWLSFQRSVSKPDRYEIGAWLTEGPDRGIVHLYVDDRPVGDPVDLYHRITTPAEEIRLGSVHLTEGNHVFRLVAESKNGEASGYHIGLRAARIQRIGYFPATLSAIGPFDNTGEGLPGYDRAYPPEREIDLDAVYPGKGGQPVKWQQVSIGTDGYLDLMPFFSERKETVAYCLAYVYSAADATETILLGSDDGGKLFVNGECVWGEATNRSAVRDQNVLRVRFRSGWNEVLMKVLQGTGQWGVYLRVYNPKGEVTYSATPPFNPIGRGLGGR